MRWRDSSSFTVQYSIFYVELLSLRGFWLSEMCLLTSQLKFCCQPAFSLTAVTDNISLHDLHNNTAFLFPLFFLITVWHYWPGWERSRFWRRRKKPSKAALRFLSTAGEWSPTVPSDRSNRARGNSWRLHYWWRGYNSTLWLPTGSLVLFTCSYIFPVVSFPLHCNETIWQCSSKQCYTFLSPLKSMGFRRELTLFRMHC